MDKYYYQKLSKYYSFLLLISILKIIQIVSPTSNNIIRLSDDNFIYNHISINSKGDMIIDTSSPTKGERKFYGLKNDGTPFFGTTNYKIISIERDNNLGRSEGEVLFVKYINNQYNSNPDECLAFIPQNENKYSEYYFF